MNISNNNRYVQTASLFKPSTQLAGPWHSQTNLPAIKPPRPTWQLSYAQGGMSELYSISSVSVNPWVPPQLQKTLLNPQLKSDPTRARIGNLATVLNFRVVCPVLWW